MVERVFLACRAEVAKRGECHVLAVAFGGNEHFELAVFFGRQSDAVLQGICFRIGGNGVARDFVDICFRHGSSLVRVLFYQVVLTARASSCNGESYVAINISAVRLLRHAVSRRMLTVSVNRGAKLLLLPLHLALSHVLIRMRFHG